MADIFISYSHKDSEQAKALADRLRASGADVWMDTAALAGAETWSAEIVSAINSSRVVIVLISATAVASRNVNKEVALASEKHKTIIPIVLERCRLSEAMEYALAGLQHVKIWDEEALERTFAKLDISASGLAQNVPTSKKQPEPPVPTKKRLLWLSVILACLGIGAASYLLFFKKHVSAAGVVKSIIVLPFETVGSDTENEYVADGLTTTLIDMLAPVVDLRVFPRSTSMEFKSSKESVKSIAASLGCRYAVNGSVQRQGDQLMINAQLTDAESGSILFSKTFFGKVDSLLELQQQIARNIVVNLELTFEDPELRGILNGKPSNPQAWDLCMKADYEEVHGRVDSSIALYQRAIRYEPQCAYPYLTIAREYGNKYNGDNTRLHDLERADSFLVIGKRLDTAQLYSHYVASWIATCHRDFDRAIAEASAFIAKQPKRAGGYALLGLVYAVSNQHALAADNFIEEIRRAPTVMGDHLQILIQLWFARDTLRLRKYSAESLPVFQAWLTHHPDDKDVRNTSIPLALVWAGRGDEACKQMESLLTSPQIDTEDVVEAAWINALSGHLDRAMQIIKQEVTKRGIQSVNFKLPFLDNIRNFPEFQAWVKQKEALQHG